MILLKSNSGLRFLFSLSWPFGTPGEHQIPPCPLWERGDSRSSLLNRHLNQVCSIPIRKDWMSSVESGCSPDAARYRYHKMQSPGTPYLLSFVSNIPVISLLVAKPFPWFCPRTFCSDFPLCQSTSSVTHLECLSFCSHSVQYGRWRGVGVWRTSAGCVKYEPLAFSHKPSA
jgi:hypothetical protein